MDFKFTFEDGSEALAHYGVKGMKWHKHLFGNKIEIKPDGSKFDQEYLNDPQNYDPKKNEYPSQTASSGSSGGSLDKMMRMIRMQGNMAQIKKKLNSAVSSLSTSRGKKLIQGRMFNQGTSNANRTGNVGQYITIKQKHPYLIDNEYANESAYNSKKNRY